MSRDLAPTEDGAVSELGATVTAPLGSDGGGGAGIRGGTLPVVDRGHYRFDGVLARGGMGKIFRAHDRRLGREVAVKELIASSPQLAARFDREVRITAQLQHPAIVSLHEAGLWTTGEPFFAMKLVAGEPLDAAIGRAEDAAARIALVPHVLAVADALAYAHSRRVIHRDLKPHNVLVGSYGETVVIDWGLAKDLGDPDDDSRGDGSSEGDGALATRHGSVLGTPAYMPPEQASGDPVDERADVYAIGAMLYHVVAGRPPYSGAGSDQVLKAVLRGAATPVTELAPAVPAELVTIIDKAMARDPEARYRSARELADDLRAFQRGKLVAAHHYTLPALLRRWLRRHRAVVAVAAAALITLAVLSALAVWRIVGERDSAQRAEQRAATAGAVAEARRVQAETQRQASETLVGFMLEELEPQLARVGRLALLGGIGTEVDRYYAQVGTSAGELDPAARARRAAALTIAGDVLDSSGDLPGARRAFEAAIALLAPAAARGDREAIRAAAGARNRLAVTLQQLGERDAAHTELTTARDALEAIPSRDRTAELELATVYRRLGSMAQAGGDLDASVDLLTRGLTRAQAALAGAPADRAAIMEAAKLYDRLGDAHRAAGDLAGARIAAEGGLELRRGLVARDAGDLDAQAGLAVSWDKIYLLAQRNADDAAAQHAADESIALLEPLVARDPDNTDWGRQLMIALMRPVELAEARGDPRAGLIAAQRVVAAVERLAARSPDNVAPLAELSTALTQLGNFQTVLGQLDAALATQRRALEVAQQGVAKDPDNWTMRRGVAVAQEYVGDVLLTRGDAAGAADAYQARVTFQQESLDADPDNQVLRQVLLHSRFLRGKAHAHLAARRDQGLREMREVVAALEAERAAGRLSAEWTEILGDYAATLRKLERAPVR